MVYLFGTGNMADFKHKWFVWTSNTAYVEANMFLLFDTSDMTDANQKWFVGLT